MLFLLPFWLSEKKIFFFFLEMSAFRQVKTEVPVNKLTKPACQEKVVGISSSCRPTSHNWTNSGWTCWHSWSGVTGSSKRWSLPIVGGPRTRWARWSVPAAWAKWRGTGKTHHVSFKLLHPFGESFKANWISVCRVCRACDSTRLTNMTTFNFEISQVFHFPFRTSCSLSRNILTAVT